MPYDDYRINIYQHLNNTRSDSIETEHQFFYAPICLLDHSSAVYQFNRVTEQPEVRFRIRMWNKKIQRAAVRFISEFIGKKIDSSHVQIIPFEKIILNSTMPSKLYQPPKDWRPYQQHQYVWFTLTCFSEQDGKSLVEIMRTQREQLAHLKLLFSLSSQTSQTRETLIRIENLSSGAMAAKLNQRFPGKEEVLISAQDEERLLAESTTNVIVESFQDYEVVSASSEKQIYDTLKSMLISSGTIIKDQSDKMWESVFWNEDNYRPDKITKTLNEIYNEMSKEDQMKLISSLKGDLKILDFKIASADGSLTIDNLEKLMKESKDTVEWDGVKFTPKPMKLSRVKMNMLKNSQSFHDKQCQLKYTTVALSIGINLKPVSHSIRRVNFAAPNVYNIY